MKTIIRRVFFGTVITALLPHALAYAQSPPASAAENRALMHAELTEIYQIIEGSGTLVTGGEMQEQRAVSDPPNLGDTPSFFVTQIGGETQEIGPGDVVVLPAGIPHRFSVLHSPMSYIIYRFEVTPSP